MSSRIKASTRVSSLLSSSKSGRLLTFVDFDTGLDKLTDLISKYRKDPTSYSPTEMRACLDSFREVLFRHLDEEVGYGRLVPHYC